MAAKGFPPRPIAERFWEKVDKSGDCWLWTAAVGLDGYGVFGLGRGKLVRAHRLSYQLSVGEIPEGLFVLHKCNVRLCVRPDHLMAGTHYENMRQMRDEERHSGKLTKETARAFKDLLAAGWSQAAAGRMFGIRPTQASRIARGEQWADA